MSIEQAKEVLQIEADGILAVRDRLGAEFEQAVQYILDCPSRLVITGIGKSGVIGQKIAATLNSTGTPSFFLHPVEAMHGDLGMVAPTDVILAISYSGETTELNVLLASLGKRTEKIIAMTGNTNSTMAGSADVVINIKVPKEACPLGLAPTTSTTVSLAVGDALAIVLLECKQFQAEDFRRNHPGGSLGERLKIAVKEVMLTGEKIPVVSQQETLQDAIIILNKKNIGAVVVIDDGVIKGIITDGDLRRLVMEGTINETDMKAVMTPGPISITRDLLAADALSIMQQHEITVLPVENDNGILVGVLHLHDLLGKGEFRFLV